MVIYIALAVIFVVIIAFILYKKKGAKKMPQGLQIWDSNGKIVFNTNYSTTYVLGSGNTGTTNGQITDDRLRNGVGWVVVTKHDITNVQNFSPVFEFNDNKLSWKFAGSGNSASFVYGVY